MLEVRLMLIKHVRERAARARSVRAAAARAGTAQAAAALAAEARGRCGDEGEGLSLCSVGGADWRAREALGDGGDRRSVVGGGSYGHLRGV